MLHSAVSHLGLYCLLLFQKNRTPGLYGSHNGNSLHFNNVAHFLLHSARTLTSFVPGQQHGHIDTSVQMVSTRRIEKVGI